MNDRTVFSDDHSGCCVFVAAMGSVLVTLSVRVAQSVICDYSDV